MFSLMYEVASFIQLILGIISHYHGKTEEAAYQIELAMLLFLMHWKLQEDKYR